MDPILTAIPETAHALRRAFDRRAAGLGVTRAQWRVLVKLSRNPGVRQVELADMLDIEPITLCRIIDRLEESGLVERRQDPSDRRARLLELTTKSEPLMKKLRGLADELSAEAFEGIEPKELNLIREALDRIRSNVAATDVTKVAKA